MSLPKETKHILLYRRLFLITYDIIAVIISGLLALALRYDLNWQLITPEFLDSVVTFLCFTSVSQFVGICQRD